MKRTRMLRSVLQPRKQFIKHSIFDLLSKKSIGVAVVDSRGKKLGMATAQSFVAALATAEN